MAHHESHSHDHHEHSKKEKWEAVDRFKSRKGREPTKTELAQILDHGHTHDHMPSAGDFATREQQPSHREDVSKRAFTIGIGGPVGSGKTALMLELCKSSLQMDYSLVAVTNDIFTQEDGEFLTKHHALPAERIRAIETGGCPHAAIREDISANLQACEDLTAKFNAEMILLESGGGLVGLWTRYCINACVDNLAANFSRELADFIIYVIDVAGGDKVPRKGGPGITQADLLVINKTDLATAVGADLSVMKRDAEKMRGHGPTVFSVVKSGQGVSDIVQHIQQAYLHFQKT